MPVRRSPAARVPTRVQLSRFLAGKPVRKTYPKKTRTYYPMYRQSRKTRGKVLPQRAGTWKRRRYRR